MCIFGSKPESRGPPISHLILSTCRYNPQHKSSASSSKLRLFAQAARLPASSEMSHATCFEPTPQNTPVRPRQADAPQSIRVIRNSLQTSKQRPEESPPALFILNHATVILCRMALPRSPAVNIARFNPGIIMPGAAEVRVQILCLAPEGNVLVEPVVSTPSQRHREAVSCQTTPREMLSSKEHLRERRYLFIRPVADAGSEQVVDVMERGASGFLANTKVTDSSKPVVEVISQIG